MKIGAMNVLRVEHPGWLSNAYLVSGGETGVLIDANGLEDQLERSAADRGIRITHVLRTHAHADHVVDIEELARRQGVPLLGWPELGDGDVVTSGAFTVRALHTPGHCADHLAFLAGDGDVFTADVLFRGTVGGTSLPDGDYDALRRSVLEVLLALPDETRVHPGHREPTTIGEERASNPFVRAWLTGEGLGAEPVEVSGRPATLLLWAPDYDGGHKALVRFPDGRETIVGGSRVSR
jgi:glyoxylase-like metal-dependent hydrolase (beta-lactamase superfamily II)